VRRLLAQSVFKIANLNGTPGEQKEKLLISTPALKTRWELTTASSKITKYRSYQMGRMVMVALLCS
jgi:hypothetical protein